MLVGHSYLDYWNQISPALKKVEMILPLPLPAYTQSCKYYYLAHVPKNDIQLVGRCVMYELDVELPRVIGRFREVETIAKIKQRKELDYCQQIQKDVIEDLIRKLEAQIQ
jgi:hypothetical protein